jgi:hypothetical protein
VARPLALFSGDALVWLYDGGRCLISGAVGNGVRLWSSTDARFSLWC